jgi:hypothetical protein
MKWGTLQFFVTLVAFLCGLQEAFSVLPNQIRIAAIFDKDGDRKHELAFKYGVERINREPKILPGKMLQAEIIRIPTGNR